MLDVHAPHETLQTWKAFFIHLATIVIGLLIAVGLEQTVEYFHHRQQVAEIRRSLYLMGISERNVARLYGDFQGPPTDTELYALIPPVPANQDVEAVREIAAPMNRDK